MKHYRNQLLESRTTTGEQLSASQAQLQEIQAQHDKLAAQVSEEDSLFRDLITNHKHLFRSFQEYWPNVGYFKRTQYYTDDIRRLRPYL